MKLSPFALVLVLVLAGCASTSKSERAYEIRTSVCELPTARVKELTGLEHAGGGFTVEASVLERVQHAADEKQDVTVSSRPRMRVLEGHTAQLSNISETDYIQDWTIDAQGKKQAVHAKAPDGIALEFRPQAAEAALELGYRVEANHTLQPMREAEVTLANGEKVTVQLAMVTKHEYKAKATLAKGQCLVVLLPGDDEQYTQLVCVRVEAAR